MRFERCTVRASINIRYSKYNVTLFYSRTHCSVRMIIIRTRPVHIIISQYTFQYAISHANILIIFIPSAHAVAPRKTTMAVQVCLHLRETISDGFFFSLRTTSYDKQQNIRNSYCDYARAIYIVQRNNRAMRVVVVVHRRDDLRVPISYNQCAHAHYYLLYIYICIM